MRRRAFEVENIAGVLERAQNFKTRSRTASHLQALDRDFNPSRTSRAGDPPKYIKLAGLLESAQKFSLSLKASLRVI